MGSLGFATDFHGRVTLSPNFWGIWEDALPTDLAVLSRCGTKDPETSLGGSGFQAESVG